ncbi:GNAT family N-acetyltransferase [Nitratireductor alexandrii]|uniref:GNAT family N-acetyltransferase n=1 Tax=Nitratireductor alexandrii TaxID=2448161 RepID=UPI000FD7C794|nr:GNAT family N-acetyltransferase [Nitratireductor alexandrii]
MTSPADAGLIIEPFDPKKHDRAAFSCGVEQVDNFFKKTANKLAKAGNLRVHIMVGAAGEVIGFYAINAHAVDYQELPKPYARSRPRHGSIPAAYMSMIGVDQRYTGRGYGGDLLVDALQRIAFAAESLGIAVVVLDVLDDGNPGLTARRKKLYEGYGFIPFKSDPPRMFLPVATIQEILGASSA